MVLQPEHTDLILISSIKLKALESYFTVGSLIMIVILPKFIFNMDLFFRVSLPKKLQKRYP